jgi:hypothetical protein
MQFADRGRVRFDPMSAIGPFRPFAALQHHGS